ncbi:hypothetical protein HDV03_005485 [Kappamyces sp. JEL0829]|nr:hypothetical protein HDV03_005485 [Kappamyces sp. JEL0829]
MRHREPEAEPRTHSAKHLETLSKQEREILKRRSRKQKAKERKMECFLCRQKGHSISNCPRNTSGEAATDDALVDVATVGSICYRCGSLEHILQKCDQKPDPKNPLPFSTCFVCKQKGHLAGQCPENERGVYPNGGSCKYCGSVRHLAHECKPMQQDQGQIMLGTMDMEQGADDDDQFIALYKLNKDMAQKKQAGAKTLKNSVQPPASNPEAARPRPKVVVFK